MHEFDQPIQPKGDPLGSLALLDLDYALATSVVEEYESEGDK